MNPIFQAVIHTILHLKRVCPHCGKTQVISAGQRGRTVPCKHCGLDIPPRRRP